jgi:hypothetical protein
VNDKEFRQHLAELLARQRNPDRPAKKNPPTPESTPKPATMSNTEFDRHLKQLVARQHNEEPPLVEKKPPKSEPSNPAAPTEKKAPTTETRKNLTYGAKPCS